jgi:Zn-dependent membrane protease YugP
VALYFLFVIPPMILAMIAQGLVSSRYARAKQMPASLTGAAAARRVLDSAGLQAVEIERVPGHLTDHYDPSAKVLRLSDEVYDGRNLAAIGIAAHEAGHAIQDATRYAPMVVRQLAVPAASFGSNSAFL